MAAGRHPAWVWGDNSACAACAACAYWTLAWYSHGRECELTVWAQCITTLLWPPEGWSGGQQAKLPLCLLMGWLCVCCRWNPQGVAPPEEHGTSHFCVVDAQRNAVSITTSVSGLSTGSCRSRQFAVCLLSYQVVLRHRCTGLCSSPVVTSVSAACAATQINTPFGSGIISDTTGILFGNTMDDFASPAK